MATDIRALTVKQPWAAAITAGKDVENRVWPLPRTNRPDWIAIHAGKDADEGASAFAWGAYWRAAPQYTGASRIVALARVGACHRHEPGCCGSPWAEHAAGVWHWPLLEVRPLPEAIADVAGTLRLWTPGADALGRLRAVLDG